MSRAARTLVAAAALVGMLAGCTRAWSGDDPAACPQLPTDLVVDVAGDLTADATGPDGDSRPESGRLPASGGSGVLYSCQWGTTEGGTGLQVHLRSTNAAGAARDVAFLREQQGPALVGDVPGSGKAFHPGGDRTEGQARWVCADRILQVDLFRPAEGTDPVTGAKTLAEAVLPLLGCPASA